MNEHVDFVFKAIGKRPEFIDFKDSHGARRVYVTVELDVDAMRAISHHPDFVELRSAISPDGWPAICLRFNIKD